MGSFQDKWNRMLRIPRKIETKYRGNDDRSSEEYKPFIDMFKELCPSSKYEKVLDIGAGAGWETKFLMDEGYTVTGITFGEENIEMASNRFNINLTEMDMHDLQYPNDSFDAIFTIQTFEHAFAPWMVILEMRKVLRDGGRVFIDAPCPRDKDMLGSIWHTSVLFPFQIKSLFEKAGFKLVSDLSTKHRVELFFEKLPDDTFEMWGYLHHVMENERIKFGDEIDWDHHVDEVLSEKRIFHNHRRDESLTRIRKYVKDGAKLLDCGCHVGRWGRLMAELGFDYTGIDQSLKALETAKKYNPHLKFIHSFLWDLDIKEKYDVAFFNSVLQHNTHEEKEKILPKIYNALKNDGILYLSESTVANETKTQLTHEGWIRFVCGYGFNLVETWHENGEGLKDMYIFRKI